MLVRVRVDGHRMSLRAFSYDDWLTASADYEACLAAILPPAGGVAVDAGAFIGRHTLAYARAVGPAGRVVAVEPLPANFRLLRQNVCQNGYAQVTCVPVALGRDRREVWLAYDRETSTASTVRDRAPGTGSRRVKAQQQPLDELLAELGIVRVRSREDRRGRGRVGRARREPPHAPAEPRRAPRDRSARACRVGTAHGARRLGTAHRARRVRTAHR